MRQIALALALAALAALPAAAADIITKAPPQQTFFSGYANGGCGAYYGVNVLGSAAPIADAPVGATAIGGAVGGTFGYGCAPTPNTFWFAEFMGDIQNLNGSANGFSLSGPAHLEQRVGFGGPINQLLSLLPNLNFPAVPSLPALPNGITSGGQQGYIYAALNEDDISASFLGTGAHAWLISPELGIGLQSRLSNNVVADVWAGAKLQSTSVCIGVVAMSCPKFNTGFVTGLSFKY